MSPHLDQGHLAGSSPSTTSSRCRLTTSTCVLRDPSRDREDSAQLLYVQQVGDGFLIALLVAGLGTAAVVPPAPCALHLERLVAVVGAAVFASVVQPGVGLDDGLAGAEPNFSS